MELRTTEEEVNKMVIEYKSLCQAETKLVELDDAVMNNDDDKDGDEASPNPTTRNAEEILSTLESLQQNLTTLEPKMNRFRKRLEEVCSIDLLDTASSWRSSVLDSLVCSFSL